LAVQAGLAECLSLGADALLTEQWEYLSGFWQNARVEIRGGGALQEAMDYDLYELLQSTGTDGVSNVAAKGLSGEG